jgi:hypothetical protein
MKSWILYLTSDNIKDFLLYGDTHGRLLLKTFVLGNSTETFEKWSILFKVKEGENFNHRNIFNISRIKI